LEFSWWHLLGSISWSTAYVFIRSVIKSINGLIISVQSLSRVDE